ncbi:MAG TPA: hypothetical protein EYH32_06990, partial [Anaerolineae bacterium]|nr:hypothetical protein [Anaerolineae bacterium]
MNKKLLTWLSLSLALALLAACGPRENCAQSHDPRDARTNRYTRTLRICTDKKKYDFGEPVHITFTVTNISDETLEFD